MKKITEELLKIAKEISAEKEAKLSEVNIKVTDDKCEANISFLITDGLRGKTEKVKVSDDNLSGLFDKIIKLEKKK